MEQTDDAVTAVGRIPIDALPGATAVTTTTPAAGEEAPMAAGLKAGVTIPLGSGGGEPPAAPAVAPPAGVAGGTGEAAAAASGVPPGATSLLFATASGHGAVPPVHESDEESEEEVLARGFVPAATVLVDSLVGTGRTVPPASATPAAGGPVAPASMRTDAAAPGPVPAVAAAPFPASAVAAVSAPVPALAAAPTPTPEVAVAPTFASAPTVPIVAPTSAPGISGAVAPVAAAVAPPTTPSSFPVQPPLPHGAPAAGGTPVVVTPVVAAAPGPVADAMAGSVTMEGVGLAPSSPPSADAASPTTFHAALERVPNGFPPAVTTAADVSTYDGLPAARASPPVLSDEERGTLRVEADGLCAGRSSSEESDAPPMRGAVGSPSAGVVATKPVSSVRVSPKRPRADGERIAVPDVAGTPPIPTPAVPPSVAIPAATAGTAASPELPPADGPGAVPPPAAVVPSSPARQVLRLRLGPVPPDAPAVVEPPGGSTGRPAELSLSNNSTPVSGPVSTSQAKAGSESGAALPAVYPPLGASAGPSVVPPLPLASSVQSPSVVAMQEDGGAGAGTDGSARASPGPAQTRSSTRQQQQAASSVPPTAPVAVPVAPVAAAAGVAQSVASNRGTGPSPSPQPSSLPVLLPTPTATGALPSATRNLPRSMTPVQVHRATMPLRLVYDGEPFDEDAEFALSNPPYVSEYVSFFDSAGRINYPGVLKPGEKVSSNNKRELLQRFRRPARAVPGAIPPLLTPASYVSFGLNTATVAAAAAPTAAVPQRPVTAAAPVAARSVSAGQMPARAPTLSASGPSKVHIVRQVVPPGAAVVPAAPAAPDASAAPVPGVGTVSAPLVVRTSLAPPLPLPPGPRTHQEELLRIHIQRATAGLTPKQLGLRLLLLRREKLIRKQIEERQAQLRSLPVELPNDVRRLAVIEAKQFKLLHLQHGVRARVLAEHKRLLLSPPCVTPPSAVDSSKSEAAVSPTLAVASTDVHMATSVGGMVATVCANYQRPTPASSFGHRFGVGSVGLATIGFWGNTSRLQRMYLVNQMERHGKMRQSWHDRLASHALAFRDVHSRLAAEKRKLLSSIDRYFRDKAKEEERRKRREMVERMNALKNNDEEAYLKLLSKTKNERLLQVLRQTDRYLSQIGAQVEKQKEAGGSSTPALTATQMRRRQREMEDEMAKAADADEVDLAGDYDSLAAMSRRRQAYYTLSHSIQEKVSQPDNLVGGTLKPYQVEGLSWLVSLFNNNLNGILADEMGLGKTIQTIALLAYLVHVKQQRGPFLVIVPLSTMSNWVRELNAWAPSLVKVVYRGDPNTRRHLQATAMRPGTFQILLTTYEFVVKDQNVLSRTHWLYIIMDEGHRMKNAHCKLAMTLGVRYRSRSRLLLTGTPLQNNLTELWALLNFLLPTIFSSADSFESWFSAPFQARAMGDAAELNSEETLLVINRLHQVLRPFLLRRLKTDVEKQLPEKVESVIRCGMSAWQRVLYRQVSAKIGIAAGGGANVRSFNNMLMQLKKICNHPYLFCDDETIDGLPEDWLIRSSGKFALLANVLPKLIATGHRVLLFSQMTRALDYLEDLLDAIRIRFLRLDGTTKAEDRQEKLEQFNEKESPYGCFLLSTRAGGLGLNLQTADTVIIFDSDWNPQMDLQAQDRAHRIGQTKEVRVFRLISSATVEVKILEAANRKLQMDAQVIQAGQFNNKSSETDRTTMLRAILQASAAVNEDGSQATPGAPSADDVSDADEVNRMAARGEAELLKFEAMDAENPIRLMENEADLPAWVVQHETNHQTAEEELEAMMSSHGRGRRRRSEVSYDDALTEREFLAAVEEGTDVTHASSRKRAAREARRRAAALGTAGELSDDSLPVAATSDGSGSGGGRRSQRQLTPNSRRRSRSVSFRDPDSDSPADDADGFNDGNAMDAEMVTDGRAENVADVDAKTRVPDTEQGSTSGPKKRGRPRRTAPTKPRPSTGRPRGRPRKHPHPTPPPPVASPNGVGSDGSVAAADDGSSSDNPLSADEQARRASTAAAAMVARALNANAVAAAANEKNGSGAEDDSSPAAEESISDVDSDPEMATLREEEDDAMAAVTTPRSTRSRRSGDGTPVSGRIPPLPPRARRLSERRAGGSSSSPVDAVAPAGRGRKRGWAPSPSPTPVSHAPDGQRRLTVGGSRRSLGLASLSPSPPVTDNGGVNGREKRSRRSPLSASGSGTYRSSRGPSAGHDDDDDGSSDEPDIDDGFDGVAVTVANGRRPRATRGGRKGTAVPSGRRHSRSAGAVAEGRTVLAGGGDVESGDGAGGSSGYGRI